MLDERQHQAGLGPRGDGISLQGGLTELLPDALADMGQASMLGLLEQQETVFQGGLRCDLRSRVGLEEG